MSADTGKLARLLLSKFARTSDVGWGRGVVKSIDGASQTAVITTTGGDINMPYPDHVSLTVADNVDVFYAGSAARVMGVIQ